MKNQDISSTTDSSSEAPTAEIEQVDESWALALLGAELSEEERARDELFQQDLIGSSPKTDRDWVQGESRMVDAEGQVLVRSEPASVFDPSGYAPSSHQNVGFGHSLSAIQVQQITFNQLKKFNGEAEARANLSGTNWLTRLIALLIGRPRPSLPPGRRY